MSFLNRKRLEITGINQKLMKDFDENNYILTTVPKFPTLNL